MSPETSAGQQHINYSPPPRIVLSPFDRHKEEWSVGGAKMREAASEQALRTLALKEKELFKGMSITTEMRAELSMIAKRFESEISKSDSSSGGDASAFDRAMKKTLAEMEDVRFRRIAHLDE